MSRRRIIAVLVDRNTGAETPVDGVTFGSIQEGIQWCDYVNDAVRRAVAEDTGNTRTKLPRYYSTRELPPTEPRWPRSVARAWSIVSTIWVAGLAGWVGHSAAVGHWLEAAIGVPSLVLLMRAVWRERREVQPTS